MLSVFNIVTTRLSQKLRKEDGAPYPTLDLTAKKQGIPANPLCLYVNGLGEPTNSSDLEGNQCVISSTLEIKAYSSNVTGSQTEARTLMDKAGDVMLSMGYKLTSGPFQDDTADYYCTVARFSRPVGDGDKLY